MLPHGPTARRLITPANSELKPVKLTGTMAFMFRDAVSARITTHAAKSSTLQNDYAGLLEGAEKRSIRTSLTSFPLPLWERCLTK